MAKLNKEQLKAKMQANSPTTNRTVTAVPLTDLTGAKPNARTVQPTPTPLKGVSKRKRAKDGVHTTQRYSFEITAELKDELEQAITNYRKATGKDISKSQVIRNALTKHLKAGKL